MYYFISICCLRNKQNKKRTGKHQKEDTMAVSCNIKWKKFVGFPSKHSECLHAWTKEKITWTRKALRITYYRTERRNRSFILCFLSEKLIHTFVWRANLSYVDTSIWGKAYLPSLNFHTAREIHLRLCKKVTKIIFENTPTFYLNELEFYKLQFIFWQSEAFLFKWLFTLSSNSRIWVKWIRTFFKT